jgi:RNA polymerase sigma-70 factor (ECF subfamily)
MELSERIGARTEDVQPSGEERLIAAAQAGDREAFDRLVRLHDRSVLRLALRFVRTEDEARDIYQESFLKAYRGLRSFRGDASFETWLLRIVSSVSLDHLRARAVRPETGWSDAADAPAMAARLDPPDERPEHDPERALARREIRRRIEAALASLPPRERLVFEMRHYEGMRLRLIGEAIGTTEETVKNCLYRAHQHLRRSLGDLGGVGFSFGAPLEAPSPLEA